MAQIERPFSVKQKVLAGVLFGVFLLLSGYVGECDRQDAASYQHVKREIAASAPAWAVTR